MIMFDEYFIRLSQAGEPYEQQEKRWKYRGLLLFALAIIGACAVGYCLYRAYEALPA